RASTRMWEGAVRGTRTLPSVQTILAMVNGQAPKAPRVSLPGSASQISGGYPNGAILCWTMQQKRPPGSTFALEAQTDQRPLAGGRDLQSGSKASGVTFTGDSAGATLDFLAACRALSTARTRLRSCGSKLKALWT